MSSNFHEDLRASPPRAPSERSTGLTFAAAALVFAFFRRAETPFLYGMLAAAVIFAVLALLAPRTLRPLTLAWFALGQLMHKVMSPVILGILFYGVVTPFGIAMRLFRDPLRVSRAPEATSYWVTRDPAAAADSMQNQF